jgi:hypothetical protein
MAIKYTNLDFGNQGLKNLITVSFTASIITSSNHVNNRFVEVNITQGGTNPGSNYLVGSQYGQPGDGYHQISPSMSSNTSNRLLPILPGDIITWDIGEFGTLSGSITREIETVTTGSTDKQTLFKLDTAITSSFNSASWVINRRIEDENYIILELPYEYFDVSITGSTKQILNGFIIPEDYNPKLLSNLNNLITKLNLE